jgi:ribonucleoside-triphosphate reductase
MEQTRTVFDCEASSPVVSALPETIRKRNGDIVPFDSRKIMLAIEKAGLASGEFDASTARLLTMRTLNLLQHMPGETVPEVESIQDVVEEVLLASPFKKTAKGYILYREQHARLRQIAEQSDMELVDCYLDRSDWQVKENSNMGFSLQGLNNYISASVSKVYWLNKLYPAEVRQAHIDGDLHIHDLGQLSVYCVGWDLQDLLISGFRGAPNKSESGPAKHFRVALGQVVNFFYTLQGEAAGAQAFANLDTLLAPFIRHDHLSYKEVKQAIQEFVFNLNVPTRVGFQTPFTNVTLDLIPPSHLAEQNAIIGGEPIGEPYADYRMEMAIFNRAFLEVLAEGDAKGRVFTFPIPTYNITEDFDWDAPELMPLWQATAKYGIPYFANFVNSDLSPDDARSMCCRLRLDMNELRHRGGGLFGANPLTGSIGVVTLNLPRLAYRADNEDDFFRKLDELSEIARTSLEIKRKVLETLTERGLYPYTDFYLRGVRSQTGKYWHNHFSTIGIVGMNEACENLLGVDLTTPAGQDFARKTLSFLRDKMEGYQHTSGSLYNLEATPAESTSYRLALKDTTKFQGIHTAGTKQTPFYTNSSQLPVGFSEDPFEVLDLQDELQAMYTGGTVLHFFVGEAVTDPMALREFVRTVCTKYHLPYFTITPTFSICREHGYLTGEQPTCPHCQQPTEVYSRVVGYLRPVGQWNDGKAVEYTQRKTFVLES